MLGEDNRLDVLEAKFDQLITALGGTVLAKPGRKKEPSSGTRVEIPIPKAVPPKTLTDKVEEALRNRGPIATDELARDLGEPADRIKAVLKNLKDKVCNVGVDARPRWIWRPGEEAPTKDLRAIVLRLIQDQPMTLRDIYAALGAESEASQSRVQGVMVEIERHIPEGYVLRNLGSQKFRRLIMLNENAPSISLPKKKRKK